MTVSDEIFLTRYVKSELALAWKAVRMANADSSVCEAFRAACFRRDVALCRQLLDGLFDDDAPAVRAATAHLDSIVTTMTGIAAGRMADAMVLADEKAGTRIRVARDRMHAGNFDAAVTVLQPLIEQVMIVPRTYGRDDSIDMRDALCAARDALWFLCGKGG